MHLLKLRMQHLALAVSLLRANGNVFNLQYLLGHSDLIMVRRYTLALGMEDTLRAHQKASLQTY
jgi:integrase